MIKKFSEFINESAFDAELPSYEADEMGEIMSRGFDRKLAKTLLANLEPNSIEMLKQHCMKEVDAAAPEPLDSPMDEAFGAFHKEGEFEALEELIAMVTDAKSASEMLVLIDLIA
jgi:hypothetical protein